MPFEPLQNTQPENTPASRFVPLNDDLPAYNYLEPDEGQDERIQFEADGQEVTAPRGTAQMYSEIENDDLFDSPSSVFDETAAVFDKQAAYLALVANAYDLVPDDQINEFVADRSRALAQAQRNQPEYMKEFQRQFDDAQGFFETAGVFLSNPRAIGRTAITQSPNSILPLMTTYAGAKLGGFGGAAVGSAVPGLGTAAGGVVGAVGGGVVGAGPGTAIVEIGAEIDSMMQEAGVDVTDAQQVLTALQNDAFMNDIKKKAERKGLTTAAVDSLFQVFGGRIVKAVSGAGKVKKVAGAAADVGVQSVGEFTGEAAGQFAKDGEVNYKEAALEAVSAIATSAGQTTIGATVDGSVKIKNFVSDNIGDNNDFSAIKGTKVVGSDGKPISVYHGTNADFENFNLDFYGSTDEGFAGQGIYFTNDKNIASEYATSENGRIVESYLDIKNPLTVTNYDEIYEIAGIESSRPKEKSKRIAQSKELTKKLKSLGYDGVIVKDKTGGNRVDEYVVFDPKQIVVKNTPDVPADVQARFDESNAFFDQEFQDVFADSEPVQAVPEVEVLIDRMRQNFNAGDLIETKELNGDLLAFAQNLNSKTQDRIQEVRLLEGKEFMPVPQGKTETLAEFLKSKGGLKADTGETAQFTKKENPQLKGVASRNGQLSLDQARELAVEAGYLQDTAFDGGLSTNTENDLINALAEEAQGNPRYRPEDMDLVQRKREAQAFNADLDEYINTQLSDVKQYATFSTAFKEGARLAKQDVKASQEAIINLIDSAKLRPADKAKFIRSIKNINSAEKARKELPKIRKRVESLLKADAVRKLRSEISKSLKKTKVKKQSGRPKGKYTPEIQTQLNELYRIDKLTKEEANLELEKAFSIDEIPTPEQRTRIAMLMAKAEASEASVESLTDLAINVKTLIQGGRNVNLYLQSVRDADVERDAQTLIDLIGEVEPKENYTWYDDAKTALKQKSANLFNNWAGTLETKLLTAFDSKDNKAVTTFVNNQASLFRESRAFDKGKTEQVLDIENRILDASGMSRKELQKRMYKDTSTMIDLGNMVHADGKTRRVQMTRAEARKRWMEFQDDSLRDTLLDEKGNRYTEEIESAIEAALDEQDIAIAQAQLEFYNEYYDRVNVVYRKLYGVDLPKIEFYSPIRRAAFDTETSEFLQGIATQGSVAPASTKSRTNSRSEILAAGDLEVMMSHIYEMEYFIAYAEKVNHMRRVFGKPEVQRALKDKMGDEFVRSINKDIDYFSGKGAQNSFLGEKALRALVRNFGFAQLAAKPQIGIKQLTSFPAMVSDVSAKDFAEGLAVFARNPKKALETLNESQFFKDRGMAIDKDFKALTEDKHFLNIMGKSPGLLKFLMLPIKYGDKGAIAFGGYGHYYAQRKAGMSHEQALESFARLANKTQQSSDIDQLSQLQQRNDVISQVLTQFMSSPNALARAEYRAIVNAAKGRISKAEFAKQFFVYHFLIPNLFQLAANGFDFDEKDQLKASLLGTANGVFLFGDILETVVSKAVTGEYFDSTIRHPIEFIGELMDFVENIAQGDIEISDFWEGGKELNAGLKAVSAATGVPLATIQTEVQGAVDVFEGDIVEGTYKMLGYSPWIIDNKVLEKTNEIKF